MIKVRWYVAWLMLAALISLGLGYTQSAHAATDIPLPGKPTVKDGGTYGLKAGTTNTKQAIESTGGAMHVTDTSASATATQAPVDPATATATKSQLAGCVGETTTVTFTDNQQGAIRCSAAGGVFVGGSTTNGSAVVGNPVLIGGSDGTNVRSMKIGTDGTLLGASATVNGQVVSVDATGAELKYRTRNEVVGTAGTIDTSFVTQTTDFTIEAATTSLRILGYSVREDSAVPAVATVVIRHDADGTCDGTAVVAFIELAADKSEQFQFSDRGRAVPSGLCADVLAGSVSLAVHLVTEAAP